MTITLPEEWRSRIESRAQIHGFESVADYLFSLVEDEERETKLLADLPGPPEISPRNREELERMLLEGMNSGPSVRVDEHFWEERRARPGGTYGATTEPAVTLDFKPQAIFDIDTAAVYLEAEREGGGQRFRDDLDQLLERLLRLPYSAVKYETTTPGYEELRVAQVSKFYRYTVYYIPTSDGITVVRCLDNSRNVDAIFGTD